VPHLIQRGRHCGPYAALRSAAVLVSAMVRYARWKAIRDRRLWHKRVPRRIRGLRKVQGPA